MPNSLRSKLSKLKYEGRITQEEYQDLINKLDGHDQVLRELYRRRKGKWIIKDGKEQGYDIAGIKTWYIQIVCSECGFIKTAIEGHTGQYHYCPNCGADMRESDKE